MMRRWLLSALALALPCVAQADITSNLYAHWPFDSGSYLNDVAGSHHLTGYGNAQQTWGKGFVENSLQLNFNNIYTYPASHSTSNNDYADVAGIDDVTDNSYTIALAFSPTMLPPGTGSANDWAYALAGWSDGGNVTGVFYDNTGHFVFMHTVSNGARYYASSSAAFTGKRWHGVAAVVDRGAGTMKLYVDGVLEGTGSFPANSAPFDHSGNPFYLGINAPGASNYRGAMAGKLDEVRLYQRALMQADVQQLLGETTVDPGPGGYGSSVYSVKVADYLRTTWTTTQTYGFSRASVTQWQQGNTANVHFAQAFSTGTAAFEVTKTGGSIASVDISPHSAHVRYQILNGKLYVWGGHQKAQLRVIVDGDDANPLFLIVNPPWNGCPGGATTYAAGVHNIGHYGASANETICLAPGAWVKGQIDARNTNNVTLMGAGVLSGELWDAAYVGGLSYNDRSTYWPFNSEGGSNGVVNGVILVNAANYHIRGAYYCNEVKAFSPWDWSTDGFYCDVVTNGMMFIGDNAIPTSSSNWTGRNTYYVNLFVVSTSNGSFALGYGGRPTSFFDGDEVAWAENIDVISYEDTQGQNPAGFQLYVENPCVGGTNSAGWGYQYIQGVRFEGNVNNLFELTNRDNPYDNVTNDNCGNSDTFYFRDITLEGPQSYLSVIHGKDSGNTIDNVNIHGLVINGTPVTSGNAGSYFDINAYAGVSIY